MTPFQIQELQCTRAESRDPSRQCQCSPRKEEEERLRASLGRV